MSQSSEPGSETAAPSAKMGIALGSLACFSTIALGKMPNMSNFLMRDDGSRYGYSC